MFVIGTVGSRPSIASSAQDISLLSLSGTIRSLLTAFQAVSRESRDISPSTSLNFLTLAAGFRLKFKRYYLNSKERASFWFKAAQEPCFWASFAPYIIRLSLSSTLGGSWRIGSGPTGLLDLGLILLIGCKLRSGALLPSHYRG